MCSTEVTILLQPIRIQDVEIVCLEDLLHQHLQLVRLLEIMRHVITA